MLSLAGACVCAVLAASSASAALPEIGRCVKLAGKTGVFNRANCLGVSKTHTGEFEWNPGPGASTSTKVILNGMVLETTTASKISCSNGQLTGEFTGAKTEKITEVVLQGCEDVLPRLKCYSNPLTPGTISSKNALVGEIGFVPGSKVETNPFVGWDLKSENSLMPFLSFSCGEGGGTLMLKLEGSLIGRVVKTNVMSTTFGLTYKQTAGKQALTAFIGGTEDVLTEITKPIGGEEKTEKVGLASGGTVTDGEALEIKAKV